VLETTVRPRAGNGVSRRQNPSMRVASFAVPVAGSRRLTRPRKQSPSRKALCRPYVPFGGGPPPGFLLPLSRVPLGRRSSVDIASLIPKSDGRFFILNWLVCKLDKYSFSLVMQASKCDLQPGSVSRRDRNCRRHSRECALRYALFGISTSPRWPDSQRALRRLRVKCSIRGSESTS
jgi:hypothetical protein